MTHVIVNENTKEGKELLFAISKLLNTAVEVLEDEDAELKDTIPFEDWANNLRSEVRKRFEK